jgi:hypothetical protein
MAVDGGCHAHPKLARLVFKITCIRPLNNDDVTEETRASDPHRNMPRRSALISIPRKDECDAAHDLLSKTCEGRSKLDNRVCHQAWLRPTTPRSDRWECI